MLMGGVTTFRDVLEKLQYLHFFISLKNLSRNVPLLLNEIDN